MRGYTTITQQIERPDETKEEEEEEEEELSRQRNKMVDPSTETIPRSHNKEGDAIMSPARHC